MNTTLPKTSVFATKETKSADVASLIKQLVPLMDASVELAEMDWSKYSGPIGYNRGWLIVRRAFLEANFPKLLVTLPEPTEAEVKAHGKDARKVAWSKVVSPMYDAQKLSWGEIMVRTGQTEGKVRASYRATGAKRDVGQRIGKGGRFAFNDPELYLEHRKAEGAHIPVTITGKPAIEQLLNAKNAKGEIVRLQRAADQATERKAARQKRLSA